jgi:transcriptional regulator with XRE-family HTH domain
MGWMTRLGDELRRRRGTRSLSDVRRECGLAVSTLSRIEAGTIKTPGRETLAALARGYGLELGYLAWLVYLPTEAEGAISR